MSGRARGWTWWIALTGRAGAAGTRALVFLLGAAGLAAVGLGMWVLLTPTPIMRSGPRTIEIPLHQGVAGVARQLQDEGIVRSRLAFILLAAVTGKARSLKAGEYLVPRDESALGVLALLASGRVVQHHVVLPEGHSLAELARLLEAERLATVPEVLRAAHDPAFLLSQGIAAESVEGYLFPDTYQLVRGMKPEEILARMVGRMRERMSPILAEIRAREITVHAALTLASIIEREAVDPSEMPLISAVFWNRMRRDMPLQADPTVQYAVGRERQRLTREDLQADSPYNTYRRPGLPPGPIGNPGLAAIRAAISPAPVGYLYFVAADDRRHHFSTTLEEHNAAVARYRSNRPR
ncbi:MAG TPA: endolytic transglycosylase MltG [Candidatus Binatia bacterium]|nr:endolytic transglycosylase MltG [Candidatus Binatia bacterium]